MAEHVFIEDLESWENIEQYIFTETTTKNVFKTNIYFLPVELLISKLITFTKPNRAEN